MPVACHGAGLKGVFRWISWQRTDTDQHCHCYPWWQEGIMVSLISLFSGGEASSGVSPQTTSCPEPAPCCGQVAPLCLLLMLEARQPWLLPRHLWTWSGCSLLCNVELVFEITSGFTGPYWPSRQGNTPSFLLISDQKGWGGADFILKNGKQILVVLVGAWWFPSFSLEVCFAV